VINQKWLQYGHQITKLSPPNGMSDNKIIQNTLHSKLAAVVGATVPKKEQGTITKKMKSNKNKQ